MKKYLLVLIIFLTGCASLSTYQIAQNMVLKAEEHGFKKIDINTGLFTIRTFSKINNPKAPVCFYIEGDGRAWISKSRISQNPTPKSNLVFQLASIDTCDNIIYIARPCQYTGREKNLAWNKAYWTDKRFSKEVIDSINTVISRYVSDNDFSNITLIGFSGGGAVAILCASIRNDINEIVTIAGNLDHKGVNKYNNVSQLQGSLNPIDVARDVKDIKQVHFIGKEDKVIPAFVAYDFKKASGSPKCIEIVEVSEISHHSGWIKLWRKKYVN